MSFAALRFTPAGKALCAYRAYLLKLFSQRSKDKSRIQFWQDKLLYHIILYGITTGVLVLSMCLGIELVTEDHPRLSFEVASFAAVCIFALSPLFNIAQRRALIAGTIAIFATGQLIFYNSFMIGCIYLMAFSIFVSLQYDTRACFGSVLFNFLLLIGWACIHETQTFFLQPFSPSRSVLISLNFTFINALTVILVHQTLKGLEVKMRKKETLFQSMKERLEETRQLNAILRESEDHYRSLFLESPLPKFIYDMQSRMILQANKAALEKYGFQPSEIEQTSIDRLLPPSSDWHHPVVTQRSKAGELFFVKLRSLEFILNGKSCELIVLSDITEIIEKQEAIRTQHLYLQEIAFTHSHVLRAPLANILGITSILKDTPEIKDQEELLQLLDKSVGKLDDIVHDIIDKCNLPVPQQAYTTSR